MLTGSGWIVVGACAGLALLAAVTSYPQAAALAAVGMAALAAAALLTRRPRVLLACTWEQVRAAEGDDVPLGVLVTNPTRRREAPLRVVPQLPGHPPATGPDMPALAAGAEQLTTLSVAGLPRGRHAVTALRAERLDPLALVRRRLTVPADAAVVVHPRTAPLAVPGRGAGSVDDGPTTDAGLRGGGVFHSLRDYQPGDDHRLIHWPSTARTGTVMVRDVVVPDVQEHLVVLETDPGRYAAGLFDEAVRVAASIVLSVSRHHRTSLATTSGVHVTCPPGDRDAQLRMLDRLACLVPEPDGTHRTHRGRREAPGVVATVVTGDVDGEGPRRRLRSQATAAAVHLVQVVPGQGGHGRTPDGISIRASGLDDFASRWNASWRG